jgi:hypothetical protein
MKAPHQTKVRPPTEPYEIHRMRQKVQQYELKLYLRGRVIWVSCILKDNRKVRVNKVTGKIIPHLTPPKPSDLKKVKVDGTYTVPRCVFCGLKEKTPTKKSTDRCRCIV